MIQGGTCLRHAGVWISFVALALATSLGAAQAQSNFSSRINVSNTSGNSISQQIAVDSHGNIDVAWTDNTSGSYALLFSRSTNGGVTFSAPINISNNSGSTVQSHHLVTDAAGNICVAWENWVSSTSSSVEFSRSVNGVTFSAPVAISGGTSSSSPDLAIDPAGAIDVAWSDNSAGYSSVFFRRSTDLGNTFSTPVNVSNNPSGAGGPYMSLDPAGNVYLAWTGNGTFNGQATSFVYFSSALEGGASFTAPTQVSSYEGPFATVGGAEVAATSASNIYVVWGFQMNGSQYLDSANSTNGGASFTSNQATGTGEYGPNEQLAIDPSGGVDIVWQASAGDGSATVYFGRTTGGSPTITNVATVGDNTPNPQLAIDSQGQINVVFYGVPTQSGTAGILFTQSANLGATFSTVQSISTDSGSLPQIALDSSGNSYVAWQAGVNAADIFFSRNGSPSEEPGFGVMASPTALTVMAPGQTVSTTLTFNSKGGFAGTGALASPKCGAPASMGITCSLTAFSLPANGTATATLTFATTAPASSPATTSGNARYLLLTLLLGLAVLYSLFGWRGQRRWDFAFAAVLFAVLVTGVGCGTAATGAMNSNNGTTGSTSDPPANAPGNSGTPLGAVGSVSVPIIINGTTQTVPSLTLTIQ
jgi:hypothetical protein